LGVGVPKKLQTNQNNIVRISLNKRSLEGSTNKNFSYNSDQLYQIWLSNYPKIGN